MKKNLTKQQRLIIYYPFFAEIICWFIFYVPLILFRFHFGFENAVLIGIAWILAKITLMDYRVHYPNLYKDIN